MSYFELFIITVLSVFLLVVWALRRYLGNNIVFWILATIYILAFILLFWQIFFSGVEIQAQGYYLSGIYHNFYDKTIVFLLMLWSLFKIILVISLYVTIGMFLVKNSSQSTVA